jgi:glycosyltransferase involved in cell wall biosynthesis
MKILAVVPAYNEEDCLASTVENLRKNAPGVDILVVNDGSTDATGQICDEVDVNHINMPVNCGLAAGVQTGMKYALKHDYDAVVQFDADGQHLPEFIQTMAQALESEDADIVIASRFLVGERKLTLRTFGNALISGLMKLTTGATITDPTSGMRMYGRNMIPVFAHQFDIAPEPDTIALLIRKGAKVVEVPAKMLDRQGGESYLKPSKAIQYMARTCLNIILFQWFR